MYKYMIHMSNYIHLKYIYIYIYLYEIYVYMIYISKKVISRLIKNIHIQR